MASSGPLGGTVVLILIHNNLLHELSVMHWQGSCRVHGEFITSACVSPERFIDRTLQKRIMQSRQRGLAVITKVTGRGKEVCALLVC